MVIASTAPSSSMPSEPMNGTSQRPVTSIAQPNTTGEMMPAMPNPKFMKPDALPEYSGAMSIGIAQIGATISSAKKNAMLRQIATTRRSCTMTIGSMKQNEPRKPATITLIRALPTSPDDFRIRSEMMPPSVSPTTPAKNTPAANSADRFRSSLYSCRKNDGSQLR